MTNETVLFEGKEDRKWSLADPYAINTEVSDIIDRRHFEWSSLQFRLIGDLSCSVWPNSVLRAYASPDGGSWCVVHVSHRGGGGFELITWLTRECASLLTTLVHVVKDSPRKKRFRTPLPDATPAQLWANHQERLRKLAGRYGDPAAIVTTPVGFATAYDRALSEGLWG